MSFLEVAGAGGSGHVFEASTAGVAKRQIRNEARERHPSRAEMHVEKSVIVKIAAVDRHRGDRASQSDIHADVAESLRTKVAVKPGMTLVLDVQAEHARHCFGEGVLEVIQEQVEPAIVIVIPEQATEAERRSLDASFGGDVAEGAVTFIVV